MKNILRVKNALINLDKVEVIYEEDGKTKIQFPGGSHYFEMSLSDFLEKDYNSSLSTENETEKELARVTRDYEELARECDQKDERIKHLERMVLLLLMDKSDRVYQELCEEVGDGSHNN